MAGPQFRRAIPSGPAGPLSTIQVRFLRFAAFLSGLRPSAARRFAVRFYASARNAFLARADLSSDVIVSRLRLPPNLDPDWIYRCVLSCWPPAGRAVFRALYRAAA